MVATSCEDVFTLIVLDFKDAYKHLRADGAWRGMCGHHSLRSRLMSFDMAHDSHSCVERGTGLDIEARQG